MGNTRKTRKNSRNAVGARKRSIVHENVKLQIGRFISMVVERKSNVVLVICL